MILNGTPPIKQPIYIGFYESRVDIMGYVGMI